MAIVTSLLLAGCTDIGSPFGGPVSTAELVILPLQSTAPTPATTLITVLNNQTTVRQVLHPDAFNTPYMVVTFPAGSLASLGGLPVGPADSVTVVVQPSPGVYGFTLSPNDLVFGVSSPSVRLTFGQYGDLSVGSVAYPTPTDYADALQLWYEVTPGQWEAVSGSGPDGLSAVQGPVTQPGTYIVAAPR